MIEGILNIHFNMRNDIGASQLLGMNATSDIDKLLGINAAQAIPAPALPHPPHPLLVVPIKVTTALGQMC